MTLSFHKYQGTGNDFILLDNRDGSVQLTAEQVAALCHRRFGIGADGLMLLEHAAGYDFRMVYYNSDGGESTMCGNGGRCIVAFAKALGIVDHQAHFLAIDGPHRAHISDDRNVSLGMKDVSGILREDSYTILDTGSPHYVYQVTDVTTTDVVNSGRSIRNEARFQPGGINVNFVQQMAADTLHVRTYERGVEDETYSCGTGVTAAAIAFSGTAVGDFHTGIITPGGRLRVSFTKTGPDSAQNVILHGPAVAVFSGEISLSL